jgi:hypothetical protein
MQTTSSIIADFLPAIPKQLEAGKGIYLLLIPYYLQTSDSVKCACEMESVHLVYIMEYTMLKVSLPFPSQKKTSTLILEQ